MWRAALRFFARAIRCGAQAGTVECGASGTRTRLLAVLLAAARVVVADDGDAAAHAGGPLLGVSSGILRGSFLGSGLLVSGAHIDTGGSSR